MPKLFYVGVKGVVSVGDTCLILKNKTWDKPFWDIPGGRMEDGETVQETLARELSEEVPSLKEYRIGELLGIYPYRGKLSKDDNGLLFITYKIEAEPFEVELSSEHSEHRWITKADLAEIKAGPIQISTHYDMLTQALR